jgi:UDPglucose--hexose-1-phosphate uridylyltransferase
VSQPELFRRAFKKPDGRNLLLFSRRPIASDIVPTSPKVNGGTGEAHLRWHPWREEWVAFASHRQDRTFLPPKEYNPLAPTRSAEFPTELPAGDYDVAVFENLFASLSLDFTSSPSAIVPTRPANGYCEVVVFTQEPDTNLGRLPADRIYLLLEVWADRYRELSQMDQLKYIMPFENRGVEVGVTLHHPHGQIYCYPFLPPIISQMFRAQKSHWLKNERTLIGDLLRDELRDLKRMVFAGDSSVAFVPACARYPYEVWVVPQRPVASPADMTSEELRDFARTLKTVLLKYDNLWSRPFPYLMTLYAAPCDGEPHPEWHFHIEFYPAYRSRDRLKYLAGTELAAGMFVNDSLPEEKAAELAHVEVTID